MPESPATILRYPVTLFDSKEGVEHAPSLEADGEASGRTEAERRYDASGEIQRYYASYRGCRPAADACRDRVFEEVPVGSRSCLESTSQNALALRICSCSG